MTVDHDALTDPELHEPKGTATAAANAVFIADGAGSGAFNSHSSFDDPDIHEPKDISTADSGDVYVANGSGGGTWQVATAILIEKSSIADQIVTAAGQLVLAHGLGAIPIVIIPQLICQVAELSYTIGDIVQIGFDQDSTTNRGISIVSDATNLTIRFGSSANTFTLLNKTSGARATLTNASWKLRVTAYA